MTADPATHETMQDSYQNPTKRSDAPVPEPEAVRESPIGTLGMEEDRTEGDGVEHETLEVRDETRIDRPLDPAGIRISTREPSVDIVMERVRRGEIDLAHHIHGSGDIWPVGTQSRLIESILLRIPLPVFYMVSDPDDNWRVVDGLRRLGALRSFVVEKRLRLRGLEYFSQFEGCGFDQLPRPMRRRITETKLTCHVIEAGTPPEVVWNLFERIGAEGEALTGRDMEVRFGRMREVVRGAFVVTRSPGATSQDEIAALGPPTE